MIQMARVSIYERFVDAVFTDMNVGYESNPGEQGVIFKRDPGDPDQCIFDFPLPDTNTKDKNKTTITKDRPAGFATRRKSESALAQKSICSEPESISNNSKFVPVGIRRESLMPKSQDSPQLKTNRIYNKTMIYSRSSRKKACKLPHVCDVCMVPFVSINELQRHKETSKVKQFECRKCCIWFSNDVSLMMHKRSRNCKQRHYHRHKVFCHFCNEYFSRKKTLQSHLFHFHGDLIFCDKSGVGEREGTELETYTNDFLKSTTSATPKNSNRSSTPGKKLRQSTLTDFIPGHKNVVKNELIGSEKANYSESDMISLDTSKLLRNSEISTFVRHTNSAGPLSRTPFVRIHVSQSFMMKLLKENVEANSPVERRYLSYDLRSPRDTAQSDTLNSKGSCFSGEACCTPTPTPRRNEKPSLRYRNLQMKFNCKECTVLLKRCDESVIRAGRKANELGKKEDSKKVNDGCTNADKVRRSSNSIKSEDTVGGGKRHVCRVCSERFISKQNMREHMKLFHTIYASSICNARYTTIDKLVNHYMRQHFVFKRKECCVCFETLTTSALAKRHMVLHCVKTIRSRKSTIPVDVEINCNRIKKPNKCRGCFKRFLLRSCLVEHEKVCRYANAQKDTRRAPNTEGSYSSVLENQDSPKANLINVEKIVEPSVQESSNEHASQAIEFRPKSPAIEAEIANKSVPSIPVTADVLLSSSFADKSNARPINGVGCAVGNKANMSDRIQFSCSICGKKFQTFKNFRVHERTFSKAANNFCNICRTGFPTKRLLQLHMLATHTPSCTVNYKFFCKFCKQGFLKKISCQTHERHLHLSQVYQLLKVDPLWNVSPSCSICNLTFDSYKRFIEHNTYYYKGHVFVCMVCSSSFQGMYLLHGHNKLVHYPKNILQLYIYKCDVCGEGFNYESHFHAHKMHVHGSDTSLATPSRNAVQEHSCALLDNDLPTTEDASKTPARMYSCGVCNLNFINQKDLSAHEIEYSTDGDFQCDKCSLKCCTSSVLAKHQSLNHTGCDISSSYKCRICGEVSTTSTSMLCHEKHFHTNHTNRLRGTTGQKLDRTTDKFLVEEHSFTCSICELKFPNELSLKNHLLEYSNIGSYSCEICQRKFTELYLLVAHEIKHSRTRSSRLEHRCPICDEGFDNASDVRTHVLHLHRYESFSDRVSDEADAAKVADGARDGENSHASKLTDKRFEKHSPAPVDSFQEENRVRCSKCDMTFASKKSLKKHKIRYVNYGDYNCTICNRRFPWQAMLKQHSRKHSNSANHLLMYSCPLCEEKFKSTVSVYCHVLHIHDRNKPKASPDGVIDKTDNCSVDAGSSTFAENGRLPERKSSDNEHSKGGERLIEQQQGSSSKRPEIAAVIDPQPAVKESKPATTENHDPDSEEKMFYYTCAECNSKHPTLREFRAHFKSAHKKDKQVEKRPGQVSAKNDADCVIPDRNSVDQRKASDRTPSLRDSTDASPNDKIESKESLPVTTDEEDDSDAVQVIWEMKRNTVDVIVIDDTDAQVIQNDRQSTVNKQTGKDLPSDVIHAENDASKLTVRSFARIGND